MDHCTRDRQCGQHQHLCDDAKLALLNASSAISHSETWPIGPLARLVGMELTEEGFKKQDRTEDHLKDLIDLIDLIVASVTRATTGPLGPLGP